MSGFDRAAFRRGLLATIALALPLGLAQKVLIDSDTISADSGINLVFFGLILFAAVIGGFAAGQLGRHRVLQTAAFSAACGFLIIQIVGAAIRAASSKPISSPITWLTLISMAAVLGMFGAVIGRKSSAVDRLISERQSQTTEDEPDHR